MKKKVKKKEEYEGKMRAEDKSSAELRGQSAELWKLFSLCSKSYFKNCISS